MDNLIVKQEGRDVLAKAFISHGNMSSQPTAMHSMHVCEVRPRTNPPSVALTSDVLPFGRLWYAEPNSVSNAIAYAMHYSRPHPVVIRVYDAAGNVTKTHERMGNFKEW